MDENEDLIQIARDYINAVQNRKSMEDVLPFFHPDIEQTEYPNDLSPSLTTRNLDQLRDASEKGKNVLKREEYAIKAAYQYKNTVILEIVWTGTVAIQIGKIQPGGQMTAYFAQFFEFEDGKVIKQRNYDCFEPF